MDARVRLGGTREPTCPACLAQRDPKTESLAEAAKYREWCREYVLPATQKRLTELEAEHKARIKHVAEREKK